MTTSQLADLIIVGCFFGILGSATGHILGKLIIWITGKVKARHEKRGKEKADGDEVAQ